MLKELAGISMSLFLTAGFATSSFAAGPAVPDDTTKIFQLIDNTNTAIEAKIEAAIKNANNLESQYLQDIQKIEEGDSVVQLKSQKSKLEDDLANTNDPNKAVQISKTLDELDTKIAVETQKIQDKMNSIQSEIDSLTAQQLVSKDKDQKKVEDKINILENQLDEAENKETDRTNKFTHDLDKLIKDLNDTTLKMSSDTINKAAAQGVQAETYWTQVELGGRPVWVDPIRVCH